MNPTDRPKGIQGLRFEWTINVGHVAIIIGGIITAIGYFGTFQSIAATQELRLHILESSVSNLPRDEQQLALQQSQIANHEAQIASMRATESSLLQQVIMVREDLASMKAQISALRQPSGN